MAVKALKHYTVPAGNRPVECRGPRCKMIIYFIVSPKSGKQMPIDCDHCGECRPPDERDSGMGGLGGGDGWGVSHFHTCVDAPNFSGKGKKK